MRSLLALASLAMVSFAVVACAPEEEQDAAPTEEDDLTPKKKKRSETASGEGEDVGLGTPTTATSDPEAPKPDEPSAQHASCQTARDLGSLSGDAEFPKITFEGKCSEWVRVRVTEQQDSVVAAAQRLKVTLVPPKGSDFDLQAFVDNEADLVECSAVTASSESEGDKVESVQLEWGETSWGNNADDSRTVAIHVKSKSGTCAAQTWTLLVEGNQ